MCLHGQHIGFLSFLFFPLSLLFSEIGSNNVVQLAGLPLNILLPQPPCLAYTTFSLAFPKIPSPLGPESSIGNLAERLLPASRRGNSSHGVSVINLVHEQPQILEAFLFDTLSLFIGHFSLPLPK